MKVPLDLLHARSLVLRIRVKYLSIHKIGGATVEYTPSSMNYISGISL